jgi:predicted CopG family antitoxin
LKTKPINSLSEAIGVNDKFLFIREIFKGNKDSFSQAISRLEHSESLEDAKAVIMSYTGDSNENEAVKELLDLVKRKLPSNE